MAICAGCTAHHTTCGYDDENDRVEDDGSYADGKFVCDACYMHLVPRGLDVGTPEQLQERASKLFTGEKL